MASQALEWALNNGMTQAQFDQRIFDYVAQNIATKSPAELRIEMDRLGIGADDVARATGVSAADVQTQYTAALPKTQAELVAKAAADAELAARTARDTTASQATIAAAQQQAATSQGLLGAGDQTAANAAAAALAAQQKAAADKFAADNAAAATAAATAAAAAKAASDKAAADAAAIAASNATAAAKAAAAKAAADAKAASDAAAAKAATDAAAAAAAKAATDAGLAAAAAAAKTAADKAAADAAAIAASNATAAQKAAAAKAAADAKAASDAAAAKAAADAAAKAAGTNSTGLAYALSQGMTQQQYYKNIFDFYSKNSGLSDSMLRSEMDRLGISPQDVAAATGSSLESVLSRYNAAKANTAAELAAQQKAQADLAARQGQWAEQQKANETAWAAQQAKNAADWAAQQKLMQNAQNAYANAPMTLGQKFGSYESIPIGAQYNPAVTPGGASPYSMVMGQMTPFQNPYASFVPGTPLGGYNPNLYNQIAVNNANAAAAKAAADAQAANNSLLMTGGGGDGNSTAAGEGPGGNSGGGEGNGATAGEAGAGYAKGGMVNGLFGMNPPGPDDGAGYLDRGEYVIKKSAVNKYGRGLLDMINEGKVPAKKIRSLLD
jgi:trimeric autotransporter adhesin